VHARDPLRRPSLQRGAQTPEHHDHVLHFDLLFLSVSFSYGAQDGRSLLGRSGRSILDIPAGTFPDQETTRRGVFELLVEIELDECINACRLINWPAKAEIIRQ